MVSPEPGVNGLTEWAVSQRGAAQIRVDQADPSAVIQSSHEVSGPTAGRLLADGRVGGSLLNGELADLGVFRSPASVEHPQPSRNL